MTDHINQPNVSRFRKISLHLLSLSLILVALFIAACQPIQIPVTEQPISSAKSMRPDAPLYATRGPFSVGYQSLISTEDSTRSLEADIWYPALNPANEREMIHYNVNVKDGSDSADNPAIIYGQALQDAAIDAVQGPYPLVVLSHGFILSPAWYSTLAEQFASHGFIVLAPEHAEQFDPAFGNMWQSVIDRPVDVKQTLDFAEALNGSDGELAGLIDLSQVAVVGHSYGGYTALAAAGAQYDLTAYKARCAEIPADDPLSFFCMPLVAKEADMAARAGLDTVPEGLWPSVGDPRVTAIISMAGDSYLFDKAGLANITVPMMAIGGTADTGTPHDWGAKPSYDYVSSEQKALVALEGAEHMIYTTSCEDQPWMSSHPFSGYFCYDPVWDKDRALDIVSHFSTAFLLDTLKNNPEAHEALLTDAVQFPGVEYTSTFN